MLAEIECGFDWDASGGGNSFPYLTTRGYLLNPGGFDFFVFSNQNGDYGKGYLMAQYVRDRFGINAITSAATSANVGRDNLAAPTKWRFPVGKPLDTTISAGGYLLIWADNDITDSGLHANFKLSAGGEEIGLFDVDGSTLVDSVVFGQQTADVSYGRFPDANG